MEANVQGVNLPLRVPRSADWSVVFFLGDGIECAKTSGGNPIMATVYNHGAANGSKVVVAENTQVAANGLWIIQNVAQHTMELANSIGAEEGRGGMCILLQDFTGYNVFCQARFKSKDQLVYSPTIVFSNIVIGEVTLSGSASSSDALAATSLEYDVVVQHIASGKKTRKIFGTLTFDDSITQIL